MKKTYNINLSNQVFCIDEDACQQLQAYIETLEKHYLNEEDGKEIMADIESRTAELITEFLQKNHKEVVSQEDIDRVIGIMGTPDAIIEEDSEAASDQPGTRKLYRDINNSIFGGVAAGIAAYFSISPAWIRLAFVIFCFFYGVTLLVYLVLWIILPKAVTAKQKLEMKGENINVSNIEKNIRNTYNEVKKNTEFQKFIQQVKNFFTLVFDAIGKIFKKIFTIFASLFSVIGILGGTFLFLLISWLLFFPTHIPWFSDYCTLYYIISPSTFTILKIILLLTINIPLLIIIYASAHYLFRLNWSRAFLLIAVGCWFLAGISGIFIAVQQSLNFSGTQTSTQNHLLVPRDTSTHKYTLAIQELPYSDRFSGLYRNSDFLNIIALDSVPPKQIYLSAPIYIEQGYTPYPELNIRKSSSGLQAFHNYGNLNNIDYEWQQQGDTLRLNNYFQLKTPIWRAQKVKLILTLPENDTLVIRGNLKNIHHRFVKRVPAAKLNQSCTVVMKNGSPELLPEKR